jgi:hypothetical protein
MPCAATIGTTIIEVRLPGMPPMQCLSARFHHRAGEVEHLVAVELALAARDEERGDLDLGEVIVRDVADDVAVVAGGEPFPRDLAADRVHRCRWLGLRDAHEASVPDAQLGEGLFGQTEFRRLDDGDVVDDVEDRENMGPAAVDLDLGERLKAFGPVERAFPVQVRDILAVGINGHAANLECAGTSPGRGIVAH